MNFSLLMCLELGSFLTLWNRTVNVIDRGQYMNCAKPQKSYLVNVSVSCINDKWKTIDETRTNLYNCCRTNDRVYSFSNFMRNKCAVTNEENMQFIHPEAINVCKRMSIKYDKTSCYNLNSTSKLIYDTDCKPHIDCYTKILDMYKIKLTKSYINITTTENDIFSSPSITIHIALLTISIFIILILIITRYLYWTKLREKNTNSTHHNNYGDIEL